MPVYTFVAIDLHGVLKPGRAFQFLDDASALEVAGTMAKGYSAIEVWLDARLIGSATPESLQECPSVSAEPAR